ncbi:MAG: response regulator [Gemmatimonadetes bacterium]|jgi:putative two-component system response regulator|nr:response regulator [Gemmatimonadota bacterium]MBT4608781.1 response regulator [Gemmatimonadota bacterium]MBT5057304.1 response regulator [Gemmatimonadota bacterium]MBT5143976.1 response regulator [Gemmatimonadota bacterium]MBT5589014.1 response regulator [Gemmatimonadota bacterium]
MIGVPAAAETVVLHIEDNPSNRKVVQHILRSTSYRLLEAEDGETGLELARSRKPDLVLLDMQLPGMSGYEVAAALKAEADTRQIPVIAVTASALAGDDTRVFDAGCDDYLAKPFRPHDLRERLAAHLPDARFSDA